MKLQTQLAEHVENPGRMSFAKYRAFKSPLREADEPFRFVDGDLIEKFLVCSDPVQGKIAEGLRVDVDVVRTMVEGLKRLR